MKKLAMVRSIAKPVLFVGVSALIWPLAVRSQAGRETESISASRWDPSKLPLTSFRKSGRRSPTRSASVDFVFPESTNLSSYKVVPPLYIASDAVLARLAEYVRGGGNLVVSLKSGFCNEFSTVRWELAPGPLRDAAGFHYQEFSTLRQPLALKNDPFGAGAENKVSEWAEMLIPDTAKPLAFYDHPFFAKYPALTRNSFGKGTLTYEGTVLSDKLQERVLLDVLEQAELMGPDQTLPATVRVKHGQNHRGKTLHYYLNYSTDPQTFDYSYAAGAELLTQSGVQHGQKITLKPWDAAIVEEK